MRSGWCYLFIDVLLRGRTIFAKTRLLFLQFPRNEFFLLGAFDSISYTTGAFNLGKKSEVDLIGNVSFLDILRRQISLPYVCYWSGAILLYDGIFNNYGTASFASNKAESGGGGDIRK